MSLTRESSPTISTDTIAAPSSSIRGTWRGVNLVRVLGLFVHAVLAATLGAMAATVLVNVVEQFQSGHVPSGYWLVSAYIVLPFGLAAWMARAAGAWYRDRRVGPLVAVDLVTAGASYSLLLSLVFLPGAALVMVWILAPAAALLTIGLAISERLTKAATA
jgi:hypothetical protein